MVFIVGEKLDINETKRLIYNYMAQNGDQITSNLGHELKHAFDYTKKTSEDVGKRVNYSTYSDPPSTGIPAIQRFIHMLYYIQNIESSVRPSEVATQLVYNNVKPEEFKKFVLNNKTFKTLKDYSEFTYEKFTHDLIGNIDTIDRFLKHINEYDQNDTHQQKIDKVLKTTFMVISNHKLEGIKELLLDDLFAMLFNRMSDENRKYFQKFRNEIIKFDGKFDEFYKYEIIKTNIEARRLYRKLSKLYAIL